MINEFLNRLQKVKKRGTGRWVALCPCHDEKNPSLSIQDKDGTIIMMCFGCGANGLEVCEILGIDPAELFPPDSKREYKQHHKRVGHNAEDILYCLQIDCARVSIIAEEMAKNAMISSNLANELQKSASRIMTAPNFVEKGSYD